MKQQKNKGRNIPTNIRQEIMLLGTNRKGLNVSLADKRKIRNFTTPTTKRIKGLPYVGDVMLRSTLKGGKVSC